MPLPPLTPENETAEIACLLQRLMDGGGGLREAQQVLNRVESGPKRTEIGHGPGKAATEEVPTHGGSRAVEETTQGETLMGGSDAHEAGVGRGVKDA